MRKTLKYSYLILLSCLSIVLISSCSKDDDEPDNSNSSIRLSLNGITFLSQEGYQEVSLLSDGYISSTYASANWISVETLGSRTITIYVLSNDQNASRSGYVRVTDGNGLSATVDITQRGANGSSGGNGGNDNPGGGGNSGGNDNPGGGGNSGGNDNPGGSGGNGGSSVQRPSAPTGVRVSNEGNNYIPDVRVRWNSVSNATNYYVYKSSTVSGRYTKIGETSYAEYGFCDTNAPTDGSSAFYKVKAVNSAGESEYSDYAKYSSKTNDSSFAPATPKVEVSGTSTIRVSWTCATGNNYGQAKSYEVYKRNPNTSEFELMTTTKSTSWSDNNPHPGINRYGVIAVNDAGSSSLGLGASKEVPLSRPSSFNATKSGSDVKFTWSKVSGATGYQIFECSSANGTYFILDQIDDGNTTSHTRYYPAQGTTKYFKIRAVYSPDYGGSPIYSDYSSYKSVTF